MDSNRKDSWLNEIVQITSVTRCKTQQLEKRRARLGASAELQPMHSSLRLCVTSSVLKGRCPVAGPQSLFCRFCRAALLRVSEEWPAGHRSLPPHIRAISVSQYPIPAQTKARSQFPSPGHGPGSSVLHNWANKYVMAWRRSQYPFGTRPRSVPGPLPAKT